MPAWSQIRDTAYRLPDFHYNGFPIDLHIYRDRLTGKVFDDAQRARRDAERQSAINQRAVERAQEAVDAAETDAERESAEAELEAALTRQKRDDDAAIDFMTALLLKGAKGPIFARWDVTDDTGEPMPFSADVFREELGLSFLTAIVEAITEAVNDPNSRRKRTTSLSGSRVRTG